MSGVMTLYLTLWIVYMCFFFTLTIVNTAKFRNGVSGIIGEVQCSMQVKLIVLIFLLGAKAYLNWQYLNLCPWEFKSAKKIYLIE